MCRAFYLVLILAIISGCVAETVNDPPDNDVVFTYPTSSRVKNAVMTKVPLIESEPDPVYLKTECFDLGSIPEGPHKVVIAYENCEDKTSLLNADRIALLGKLIL